MSDPTYGVYVLELAGPPALLQAVGLCDVTVKGFNRDGRDRHNLEYDASQKVAKFLGVSCYDEVAEQFTPMTFSAPERTANLYRNVDGTQQWFIGVYEVGRSCAGPEEGGQWYDTGELVQQTVVATYAEMESAREVLAQRFPRTDKRYSVLGGEDYDIRVDIEPMPEFFPETIPHYE